MQFQVEAVVEGVSYFNDSLDGKAINSGTLFIKQPLDTKSGRAKGFRTVEERCEDSQIVQRILHNDFPLKCKVTYERKVTKNAEKMVVVECMPIGSPMMPEKKA